MMSGLDTGQNYDITDQVIVLEGPEKLTVDEWMKIAAGREARRKSKAIREDGF